MKKDTRLYLLDIRDALDDVTFYTKRGKNHFLGTKLVQDAVTYRLAVVGEAVKKLPQSIREAHPEIPWKDIAGLRDVAIHQYDGMDIREVWNIVKKDVPVLLKAVNNILEELGPSQQIPSLERRRATR